MQLMLEAMESYGPWIVTNKCDEAARFLADRHYSRNPKSVGSPQFTRPGKNLVLRTAEGNATLVIWSGIRDDGLKGVYEITLFRNESNHKSSDLIKYAFIAVKTEWGIPLLGIVTYVNAGKIKSDNPGACFKRAGFSMIGKSKKGLHLLKADRNTMLLIIYETQELERYQKDKEEVYHTLENRRYLRAMLMIRNMMRRERNIKRLQNKLKSWGLRCSTDFKPKITNEELEEAKIAL